MTLRSRCFGAVVSCAALLTITSSAAAQPAETTAPPGTGPQVNGQSVTDRTTRNSPVDQFGRKHSLVLSSDAALSIANTSLSGVDGSSTTITIGPSIDYFVIPNLSLGGTLLFDYTSDPGGHSTRFGIGPRVGYNLPISDLISVWPKAGFSIAHTSVTTDAPAGVPGASDTTRSNDAIALNLFVPFMFHPAPHFFAGFGPFLDTDLSGDAKATSLGGKLTLGGWIPVN